MNRLFLKRIGVIFYMVLLSASANAALDYRPTSVDIIVDGVADSSEWTGAGWEQDVGGASMGAMYGLYKDDYLTYTGRFQFLMHNIEQGPSAEDADYNVFEVYDNGFSDTDPLLLIWVFNDVNETNDSGWLGNAGLSGDYSSIDDRGFLVKNNQLNQYSQWLPGDVRPEDGGYSWDDYWGFYARGGFNNSAFDEGLPAAQDSDNELYEVVFETSILSSIENALRRSILDPDQGDPLQPLIVYRDAEIPSVPIPGAIWLLGSMCIGLLGFRKKQQSE